MISPEKELSFPLPSGKCLAIANHTFLMCLLSSWWIACFVRQVRLSALQGQMQLQDLIQVKCLKGDMNCDPQNWWIAMGGLEVGNRIIFFWDFWSGWWWVKFSGGSLKSGNCLFCKKGVPPPLFKKTCWDNCWSSIWPSTVKKNIFWLEGHG